MPHFSGWDPILEQRRLHELRAASVPAARWFGDRFDNLRDIPDELDPRRWHVIEDQGPIGSCQGHALSTCGEFCYWVQTRGDTIQFSRWFAYRATQVLDGIQGDRGSTITGGARCAKEVGFLPETDCPYPRDYHSGPPITRAMYDSAAKHRMRSSVEIRSYDDCFKFIAGGQGIVEIGIAWGNALANCTGVVEQFTPGPRDGGHAVVFGGYSKRKDSQGRHYLWLCNSHSRRWANGGYAEVAPVAIEQMLRHQWSVFVGLSDLDGVTPPKPREINFIDNSLIG